MRRSFHLYYPDDDHPAECFHGAGYTAAGATIASFCPGNNAGRVLGTVDGMSAGFPFEAGGGGDRSLHMTWATPGASTSRQFRLPAGMVTPHAHDITGCLIVTCAVCGG
jgi:hypothetical protein